MSSKNRESGIELLRILAAIAVVMLHYNDGRAFSYVAPGSVSQYILFLLESISICAVDLFVLISGYYLSGIGKRSLIKPLQLIVQLVLIREAFYIVKVILHPETLSLKVIIAKLIPSNYFIILYCALYLISPYINVAFDNLSSKGRRSLVITALLLFSVWTTFVDLAEEIRGAEWKGLSTVTAWGSKQGFSIVNFMLVYCIGAYLRKEKTVQFSRMKLVLLWVLSVVLVFAWAVATQRLTRLELRSAWVYHNPFVILSAVLLFLVFKELHFSSKIINELSRASFTCFLIHGALLGKIGVQKAVDSSPIMMILHIAISLPVIYLVSWVVYKVYSFSTEWFFRWLSRFNLFQPREVK